MSVYAIVLVKRTRVVSQLMVPLYGSEDTLRPCVLLEGFSQVSRPDPSWLNTLCELSLYVNYSYVYCLLEGSDLLNRAETQENETQLRQSNH